MNIHIVPVYRKYPRSHPIYRDCVANGYGAKRSFWWVWIVVGYEYGIEA